jgi:hypothetical protein
MHISEMNSLQSDAVPASAEPNEIPTDLIRPAELSIYQFKTYARSHFRPVAEFRLPHSALETRKLNKTSLDVLISYSPHPLETSLLRLPTPNLEELAVESFSLMRKFMMEEKKKKKREEESVSEWENMWSTKNGKILQRITHIGTLSILSNSSVSYFSYIILPCHFLLDYPLGLRHPMLRDELFCQVVKQTSFEVKGNGVAL